MYRVWNLLWRYEEWMLSLHKKRDLKHYVTGCLQLCGCGIAGVLAFVIGRWDFLVVIGAVTFIVILELQPIDRFAPGRALSTRTRRLLGTVLITFQALMIVALTRLQDGGAVGLLIAVSLSWLWLATGRLREKRHPN